MKSLKVAALTIALLASGSAFAAQKDITVTAEVDNALDMLQPDGSNLPSAVRMSYIPGVGLQAVNIQTKIFTNDITKKVTIKLANDPKLALMNSVGPAVDLAVSYNNIPLTMNGVDFEPAALNFSASASPATSVGASQTMPLTISQKTAGSVGKGSYQGVVSFLLTQAP